MTLAVAATERHSFSLAQYLICMRGIVWREALRFIGVNNMRFLPIGPTTGPAEPIRAARENAHRRPTEMAARF